MSWRGVWLCAIRASSLSSLACTVSSWAKPAARSIWRMIGKKALSVRCGEQKYLNRVCGSLARRSNSAAVRRDLPMPGSPESNTTWPSPAFAVDHRRRSSSSSSSRPTSSVTPLACRASKRLSTEAGRNATHTLTGPEIPLRSRAPRSSSWNRLPNSFRVLSAMTTAFGSAMPCSRAARFGVSPTMACS